MNTLYAQVCNDILGRIQNGDLKVGDRLPPEKDYAEQLGVSRSTLRLAYDELQALGVLKRQKRVGTKIISSTPKQHFSMATSGIGELLKVGSETAFDVIETRTVRTEDIPQLKGEYSETGYWLEVFGTRSLRGETRPFSVNYVYVPARYAAIEPVLRTSRSSVFRVIEQTFDVTVGQVEQIVRAVACPPDAARIMGLKANAPSLAIDARLSLSDGTLMEVSVAVFDPNRFQVHTEVQIDFH